MSANAEVERIARAIHHDSASDRAWECVGDHDRARYRGYARSALAAARYLVWSNEHRAWWAPDRSGYTRSVDRAGRNSRDEALEISRTRGGGWPTEDNPFEIAIPERDAVEQAPRPRTAELVHAEEVRA